MIECFDIEQLMSSCIKACSQGTSQLVQAHHLNEYKEFTGVQSSLALGWCEILPVR